MEGAACVDPGTIVLTSRRDVLVSTTGIVILIGQHISSNGTVNNSNAENILFSGLGFTQDTFNHR